MLSLFMVSLNIMTIAMTQIISSSILGICSIYEYLNSHIEDRTIQNYKNRIDALDINLKLEYTTNIYEKFLSFNDDKNITLISNKLHEISLQIQQTIKNINMKIEQHQTKYFHRWRLLNLNDDLQLLEKQMVILNNRIILIEHYL